MGVDGIGSGGGRPPGRIGSVEPGAVRGPGAAPEAARPGAAAGPEGSAALDQLRRGEIDLGKYLDTRVADATRHLEGRLPGAELDFVRASLRVELEADPVLAELVRRATGTAPRGVE